MCTKEMYIYNLMYTIFVSCFIICLTLTNKVNGLGYYTLFNEHNIVIIVLKKKNILLLFTIYNLTCLNLVTYISIFIY